MRGLHLSKDEATKHCTKLLQKAESLSHFKFTFVKRDSKLQQKTENLDRLFLSLRLNVQSASTNGSALSQILKSNSTFCSDKQKKERDGRLKSIEDTPESIKNKLSVCKSIVDPKEVKLLGQIDFCESLVADAKENDSCGVAINGSNSNKSTGTGRARSRYNIADEQ